MAEIYRGEARGPIWVEHDDSRYLINPWEESIDAGGILSRDAYFKSYEKARDEAVAAGLTPPREPTEAQMLLAYRRGEVSEMILSWENVVYSDTKEQVDCTASAIMACLVGNFALTSRLYAAALEHRRRWAEEKNSSAPSRLGTGAAEPESAGTAET